MAEYTGGSVTTYYVNGGTAEANDTFSGTIPFLTGRGAGPWATIQKAFDKMDNALEQVRLGKQRIVEAQEATERKMRASIGDEAYNKLQTARATYQKAFPDAIGVGQTLMTLSYVLGDQGKASVLGKLAKEIQDATGVKIPKTEEAHNLPKWNVRVPAYTKYIQEHASKIPGMSERLAASQQLFEDMKGIPQSHLEKDRDSVNEHLKATSGGLTYTGNEVAMPSNAEWFEDAAENTNKLPSTGDFQVYIDGEGWKHASEVNEKMLGFIPTDDQKFLTPYAAIASELGEKDPLDSSKRLKKGAFKGVSTMPTYEGGRRFVEYQSGNGKVRVRIPITAYTKTTVQDMDASPQAAMNSKLVKYAMKGLKGAGAVKNNAGKEVKIELPIGLWDYEIGYGGQQNSFYNDGNFKITIGNESRVGKEAYEYLLKNVPESEWLK